MDMNSMFYSQIKKSLNRDVIVSLLTKKYPLCEISIIRDIENYIYQYISNNTIISNNINTSINIFIKKYNYYVSEIYNNIPSIVQKIQDKEIILSDIILNPIHTYSKNWDFVIKRKEQEDKLLKKELVSNSSITKCYKCKEKNVFVQSIQTRGSDEPATIFYTCLTCNNKWRT